MKTLDSKGHFVNFCIGLADSHHSCTSERDEHSRPGGQLSESGVGCNSKDLVVQIMGQDDFGEEAADEGEGSWQSSYNLEWELEL